MGLGHTVPGSAEGQLVGPYPSVSVCLGMFVCLARMHLSEGMTYTRAASCEWICGCLMCVGVGANEAGVRTGTYILYREAPSEGQLGPTPSVSVWLYGIRMWVWVQMKLE